MTEARDLLTGLWRRCHARSSVTTWIGVALVALLVALVLPNPLRSIVTLPILVSVPGAALQHAFGRRLREGDRWLALALAVALSFALLPLSILLAYAVHKPLDPVEIVLAVIVVTGALGGVGAWRYPDARAAAPEARGRVPGRALAAALVLVCAGVIVLVSWSVLPGSTPASYSAIALDGRWATTSRVTVVAPHHRLTVRVRVENHTRVSQRYRVVPAVNGSTWKGAAVTLAPNTTWTGSVSGTMPTSTCLRRLEIALRCQPEHCTESLVLWLATKERLPATCSSTRTGA